MSNGKKQTTTSKPSRLEEGSAISPRPKVPPKPKN
jgi:hypothetical protein